MGDIKKILINYIPKKRWMLHVLFWIIILTLLTFAITTPYGNYYIIFVRNLFMLVPQLLASYLLVYYQVPKLLYKHRYFWFFLSLFVSCYLLSALARVIVIYIIEELFRPPPFTKESVVEILKNPRILFTGYFFNVYTPAIIMFITRLVKEKFEEEKKLETLEKDKVKAELNFLKAQIHPHFLFNTLNNLYVLARKKSDKAPEAILKLSEILDYILYGNPQKVSVEKEIHLIKNYINLEQLRYGERLTVIVNEKIDNPHTQMPPLILISIIENAFKHGVNGLIEKPEIKIDITVNNSELFFEVYNTKPAVAHSGKKDYKNGIGLKNTISQLQLLYPKKHTLEIKDGDGFYIVKLYINLNIT
ncbi:sensor histidine kinase [Abyssalbus ytuae]|uniref:Sensor histidine kinase n=1 Tax=Abyssalbus ytuae TaxID=2926907 RepID=A0A9E6ZSP2_9FLAO|nr:sensor histidine kinase [Abyssalbus ytuae]UOB15961.1 sensor histidine kinase [Abyssalbus ytuae]